MGDEYAWPFRLRPAVDPVGHHYVHVYYHGESRPAYVTERCDSRMAAMREARMFVLYTILMPQPMN